MLSATPTELTNAVRDSYMLACIDEFWLLGVTLLVMIPLTFVMNGLPRA